MISLQTHLLFYTNFTGLKYLSLQDSTVLFIRMEQKLSEVDIAKVNLKIKAMLSFCILSTKKQKSLLCMILKINFIIKVLRSCFGTFYLNSAEQI